MYGNKRFGGPAPSPVSVGEEIDVKIEAVGEKGDGIARRKGFVLFVPNTNEGDEVRIRITKVLRKVGFAEVIGAAQAPIESEKEAPKHAPREPAPMPEPVHEENPEDTEYFGEEPPVDEEPSVEEPVDEEPSVEEPVDDEELDVPAPPSDEDMDVPPPPGEEPESDDEEDKD